MYNIKINTPDFVENIVGFQKLKEEHVDTHMVTYVDSLFARRNWKQLTRNLQTVYYYALTSN
jgi:peroxiredoxin